MGTSGCAAPEIRFDQSAHAFGFERAVIEGAGFRHVIYRNRTPTRNDSLHIYLDGDGTPWIHHHRIADNPTPRNATMLKLMAMDSSAAVYLGRPCYHGMNRIPPCTPTLWTNGRYSEPVLKSMALAIQAILASTPAHKVVLIGYSGGGALAMLLVERLKEVAGIVTIAGNLDPNAWTEKHGYSPLTGSENPATRPALPASIFQIHLAGAKDVNIPPELIRTALQKQPSPVLRVFPDADHDCCWDAVWPSILVELARREQ